MSKTRWAVVGKADRAGRRPRGWPVDSMWAFPDSDGARAQLHLMQTAGHTSLEVVEVQRSDDGHPMWIQVGTEPDAEAPREVVTLDDLRAALEGAGWANLGHNSHHAMLWTYIHGDVSVTALRSGRATMVVDSADLCGSLHGSPAAVLAELRRMGVL